MAVITYVIGTSNGELIRDKIAVILAEEFGNQYVLNNSQPKLLKVWCERNTPFDEPTELPTINVTLAEADFDLRNPRALRGDYTFYIDIYTMGMYTQDEDGDKAALLLMTKIAGMVRVILSVPEYKTLGLPNGLVQSSMLRKLIIATKETYKDALSTVVGRMEFCVKATEENAASPVTPVPLLGDDIHVTLNADGTRGMSYAYTTPYTQ